MDYDVKVSDKLPTFEEALEVGRYFAGYLKEEMDKQNITSIAVNKLTPNQTHDIRGHQHGADD